MTKEQFLALGFTEEQAIKAAEASAEELKAYIPKTRFDEVNTAKVKAEKDVTERDKQLETLKADVGASDTLKTQIATLQSENTAAKEKHEAELKDLTVSNAIKTALIGKVHDESLAAGLVDKTKLVIDGDKIVGLDEQVTALKASKAFLFKEEAGGAGAGAGGNFKVGGAGGSAGAAGGGNPPSLKDAITAHFQTK